MLLSPRNERSSEGDGARVLVDVPNRLPELFTRLRLWSSMGGGDGVSMGAMETLPAMRDTRC